MGEFLKERAEEFLEEAEVLFKKKKYGLSAFHFQQAAELFLKYYLSLEIGDFSKTHSLKRLLSELGESYKQEKKVKSFMDSHISVISEIEKAYITSRYFPTEFVKPEVQRMQQFLKKLLLLLRQLK